MQIRGHRQLEETVMLKPCGEEQNFQTLDVAGVRIESRDDVVAQLLDFLFGIR